LDPATVIGLIGLFVILASALLFGGSAWAFVDSASLLLVLGGTSLVTLAKFGFKQLLVAGSASVNAFVQRSLDLQQLTDEALMLARLARSDGLLALERADINNAFLRKAIELVVDGREEDVVRNTLVKDIELSSKRDRDGQAVLRALVTPLRPWE
jgi:chemotaxis protein MotA